MDKTHEVELSMPGSSIKPTVMAFMQELMKNYLMPLYDYVQSRPHIVPNVAGFLLEAEEIVVYIGRTHFAVEYSGSEIIEKLNPERKGHINLKYFDYSTDDKNLFEKIIGFEYDSTVQGMVLPLPPVSMDFLMPTNRGWDQLTELRWNFAAQDSVMGFNMPALSPPVNKFARVINGLFFDQNESGLVTRHIKWLDFFPIIFDDSDPIVDKISFSLDYLSKFVEADANFEYPMPDDYKYSKLPRINRFIEIWGNSSNSEPDITRFLSFPENNFILTMRFGAKAIFPELICEWQSEARTPIRPDFFVLQPNGYADIVEFKLPEIEKNFVVGQENREAFGAWLSSYIAQTRVYANYFDDPNNRKWFEGKYGFKVHKPRRWLIVGRRHDFESSVWREIVTDYRDLEILNFDDLIDGVVVQFYK